MKYRRKNYLVNMKQGFTILELLIVVIIVSVLASVAFPKMVRFVKRAYIPEAMGVFSFMNGRMELAYVQGNNSYTPMWTLMNQNPLDLSPVVSVDRPEDAPGAHFCYTLTVMNLGQAYEMRGYYTDNAAVTCPPGSNAGAFINIPDYIKFTKNNTTRKITYQGYGDFAGYASQ